MRIDLNPLAQIKPSQQDRNNPPANDQRANRSEKRCWAGITRTTVTNV
jgi:hypothetical protein